MYRCCVRHFSLHILYFFHILSFIFSLASILFSFLFLMVLKVSILQGGLKMPVISFLVLCASSFGHSLLGSLLGPIDQIFLIDLLEIGYYFPCILFSQNYQLQRSVVLLLCNDACWKTDNIWRKDHMKLLKNRSSFCPVECNSCYWKEIAGQNLALQTCVFDFPSALSAVWETNQSS